MTHADYALYSGSTKKTSELYMNNTTSAVLTISGGSWTRDEVLDCRFGVYCLSSSSTASNRQIDFYGADISVVYTYQEEKFMLRIEGRESITLPPGYTRLEYIESTGAQYINWGFIPNGDTRIVMDCQMLELGTNCYYGVANASSGASSHSQTNTVTIFNGTSVRSDWYGTSVQYTGVPAGRHIMDKNKNVTYLDGAAIITNTDSSNSSAYPVYLFARNIGNTSTDLPSKMRDWSCQAYDNGTLIRDCYPCINPNGVPGLYDIVNGVFYGSATSTPFVAGPVCNAVWHDVARVFKKVNGIWVEQEELANVIEDGVRYKNGGEIESTKPTFTIQGVVYQFEDGMTWGEWVASSYNTGGFVASGTSIKAPSGLYVYNSASGSNVKTTDSITSGSAYGVG